MSSFYLPGNAIGYTYQVRHGTIERVRVHYKVRRGMVWQIEEKAGNFTIARILKTVGIVVLNNLGIFY